VLALTKEDAPSRKVDIKALGAKPSPSSVRPAKTDVVRMELAGASPALRVEGGDKLPGIANYFIGNDPAKWHSNVPTYAKVKYSGVYPGVDLVYYGNQRHLEYDFVVTPGADPKPVRLHFAGAEKLALTEAGDLTVSARNGQIIFHKPVIYQTKDGRREPVNGQFALLAKNTVGFDLGAYDHARALVIDPMLAYSSYLGGGPGWGTDIYAIAVDGSGNAYVTGETASPSFPVTNGAFETVFEADSAFITKFNPSGTVLVYSTYLGESCAANGQAIAVDGSGNAYVAGTKCGGFPTTAGAFDTTTGGAFVTKLNSTGSALVYSTLLGGNSTTNPGDYDAAYGIAVDESGNAYVTGGTGSPDFPVTAGAFQKVNKAPTSNPALDGDAFVTKLNPAGSALVYSTSLGGSVGDIANGIAVDNTGAAYVTGFNESSDFPLTPGAFQTVKAFTFVTKLNSSGLALVYSTYLASSTRPLESSWTALGRPTWRVSQVHPTFRSLPELTRRSTMIPPWGMNLSPNSLRRDRPWSIPLTLAAVAAIQGTNKIDSGSQTQRWESRWIV